MTVPPVPDLASLPNAAPPKSFGRRHRGTIAGIFWIVFVATFLITLFQEPIYQSTAVIALSASSDPAAEAKALQMPNVLSEASAKLTSAPPSHVEAHAIDSGAAMPGRFALVVESDSPDYAAALADSWADTVTADSSGKTTVLQHAVIPVSPIRPKKAQSILLGAILGLILGFTVAGFKEAMQNRKPA